MGSSSDIKRHQDGGTYTVLAFAETRNGWGISLRRWTTYRNEIVFEVHRVSDDDTALRLNYFGSQAAGSETRAEAKARAFANEMWKRDR